MNRQLFKSRKNKVFSGVCGGLAEYFKIDPSIVRVAWILISLAFTVAFGGLIIYIIASIIIPERPADYNGYNDHQGEGFGSSYEDNSDRWSSSHYDKSKGRMIIGGVLILFGLMALVKQFFRWIDFSFLWPLILMGIGALVIYFGRGNGYE